MRKKQKELVQRVEITIRYFYISVVREIKAKTKKGREWGNSIFIPRPDCLGWGMEYGTGPIILLETKDKH